MKSYKCEYCNLTNWVDVIVCKRCQMPNPYLPEHEGINDSQNAQEPFPQYEQSNQIDINQTYQNQTPQGSSYQTDTNTPPPPNVYGQRAGNTNYPNNYGQNQMQYGNGFDQIIPNDVDMRFNEAILNINKAYKAGRTYCIVIGILFLVIGLIFLVAASAATNSQNAPPEARTIVAFAGVAIFFVFAVIIGLVYGLTYGVKRKSRACAIILVVMFGLGIITNFLSVFAGVNQAQSLLSLLFAVIMTYYFSLGIKGTFAYHEIIEQYPTLKQ